MCAFLSSYTLQDTTFHVEMTEQKSVDWGLDRISPPSDTNYRYKYDGSGVKAYILDSGIRETHIEYTGRTKCGFSLYPDGCLDVHGHGTHVSGIVGGIKSGVAKNVNLIAVKVLNNTGDGTATGVIAGIDYVVKEKMASPQTPTVINMSLGAKRVDAADLIIANVVKAGIVVVVAAGNEEDDACLYSPASSPDAITVGSTTLYNLMSYFTNVGRCVDIFAPGSNILSASNKNDTGFVRFSGTSMAAPFVSGVAVLHLQKNPQMTPNQVWNAIRADSHKWRIRRFSNATGAPNRLVNAKSLLY
jgi:subtilisin family serine protease